jgi:hypothetical protein
MHRLAGEALLAIGAPVDHAEVSLRNAIWVAGARQVVAFERRAGMSLALLLAGRGRGTRRRGCSADQRDLRRGL